jgi:hypothetical protein
VRPLPSSIREERRKRKPKLRDAVAQWIFRFGEFGAITSYAYAAFILEHNLRNHQPLINAMVFVAAGFLSYCTGWIIRFAISRQTDLL